MADNTQLSASDGLGSKLVTKELAHSGDTAVLQGVSIMVVSGSEGSWTAVDLTGDATYGLDVDVTRLPSLAAGTNAIGKLTANDGVDIGDVTLNNASIAVTGTFWQATQPVSLATVPSHEVTNAGTFAVQATLAAETTKVIGTVNVAAAQTIAVTNAGTFLVQAAQSGTWNVGTVTAVTAISNALPAGDNNIGNVDIASALPAGTNVVGYVGLEPRTSGGLTPSKTVSEASTNATSVKGSAGQLYGLFVTNINAAVRYLKLYNKATAPTVGTDTPVLTFAIPGDTAGAGFTVQFPHGVVFDTGIAFALTTGVADSDTGAVSANEHVVNVLYK